MLQRRTLDCNRHTCNRVRETENLLVGSRTPPGPSKLRTNWLPGTLHIWLGSNAPQGNSTTRVREPCVLPARNPEHLAPLLQHNRRSIKRKMSKGQKLEAMQQNKFDMHGYARHRGTHHKVSKQLKGDQSRFSAKTTQAKVSETRTRHHRHGKRRNHRQELEHLCRAQQQVKPRPYVENQTALLASQSHLAIEIPSQHKATSQQGSGIQ